MGLGLAIADSILREYNGSLKMIVNDSGDTVVSMLLPLSSSEIRQ